MLNILLLIKHIFQGQKFSEKIFKTKNPSERPMPGAANVQFSCCYANIVLDKIGKGVSKRIQLLVYIQRSICLGNENAIPMPLTSQT